MWTDSFGQKPVNNFIDYEFNYRIDSLFTICIEKKLLKTENYYIEIYRHSMDTMVFALRAYNPNFPIYDSVGDIIDFTGFLIDKTNRYTLINKKYYPVLTEYDYDFGILKMIGDDEGHQVILRSEFHPLSFYIYTDAYQKVIGIRYQ